MVVEGAESYSGKAGLIVGREQCVEKFHSPFFRTTLASFLPPLSPEELQRRRSVVSIPLSSTPIFLLLASPLPFCIFSFSLFAWYSSQQHICQRETSKNISFWYQSEKSKNRNEKTPLTRWRMMETNLTGVFVFTCIHACVYMECIVHCVFSVWCSMLCARVFVCLCVCVCLSSSVNISDVYFVTRFFYC